MIIDNKAEPKVIMYKLFDLQVCVPGQWTDEDIKRFANTTTPAGTSNGWMVMKSGHKYLGGDPERVPCAQRHGCVHVRLEC